VAANEPLTFKVSAEFKRQFRMAAADRGIRLNELLIQAFDAWKAKEAA
jgi:predicted HicB family RNase H-like nuclease